MYPPCETVARSVLPVFRSLVAKELIEKYNYTQIEAAKKLGTTQAAISQYVHSKRGSKAAGQFREVSPMLQDAASEAAKRIATKSITNDEVMAIFCKLCTLLREEGKIFR